VVSLETIRAYMSMAIKNLKEAANKGCVLGHD
jgi:hypothetical protein